MALIYTIPQSHCVIIERFGKFNRVQKSGVRFKLPFGIEKIKRLDVEGSFWGDQANKEGYLIELTEQQTDTPTRKLSLLLMQLIKQCHSNLQICGLRKRLPQRAIHGELRDRPVLYEKTHLWLVSSDLKRYSHPV